MAGGSSGVEPVLEERTVTAAVATERLGVHDLAEVDATGAVREAGREVAPRPCTRRRDPPAGAGLSPVPAGETKDLHSSPTVDAGLVVSGSVELALPGGAVTTLAAGDSFVLRGIDHSWTNPGYDGLRAAGRPPAAALAVAGPMTSTGTSGAEIVGAAVSPFGKHLGTSLAALAQSVAAAALADADLTPGDIDGIVFANAAEGVLTGQEMIRGQVALDGSELAGPAVINVENACASGSTAVHLAIALVTSGRYDCVLALGAEELFHPDKERSFAAIKGGVNQAIDLTQLEADGSVMMGAYAAEARSYADRHGPVDSALAQA